MTYLTNLILEEKRHDWVIKQTPRGTAINFTLRMCVNASIKMVRRNGSKAKTSIAKEMAKVGGALLATWNEVEDILAKEQLRKPIYATNGHKKVIFAIDSNGDLFPYR